MPRHSRGRSLPFSCHLLREAGRRGTTEERRFDPALVRQIVLVGLPAAAMVVFEVGVFAVATQLIGRIDAVSLAAHQVALTLASVTFMVPLGVSAAGGVRVGQAVGRGDAAGVARAGWTAFLFGAGFMGMSGAVFALAGSPLTPGDPTIAMGAAAAGRSHFQLFDGTQVVACGLLRGLGETRIPMFVTLVGYWMLGLPIGWYLAFPRGMGARGLWLGLMTGLIVVGFLLLLVWMRKARAFRGASG
jgi:MATE family multidrug resistance protein